MAVSRAAVSSPAATRARYSSAIRSNSSPVGRPPWLGTSIAATANPPSATKRHARARMPGAFLCCPPPCPIRIRGRAPWAPSGVHSTPGISPRAKSCSVTPSNDVVEMKRIAFQAFRDPSCGCSLDHAREGDPTGHGADRSHLPEFAAVHGGAERITKGITRVSPGRTFLTGSKRQKNMVDYIREESLSDNVIAGNPGSLAGRPVTSTGPGRPVFEPEPWSPVLSPSPP